MAAVVAGGGVTQVGALAILINELATAERWLSIMNRMKVLVDPSPSLAALVLALQHRDVNRALTSSQPTRERRDLMNRYRPLHMPVLDRYR